VQRLVDFESRLADTPTDEGAESSGLADAAEAFLDRYRAALDDDFNSADAMGALFSFVGTVNGALDGRDAVPAEELQSARDALASADQVLGILETARRARAVDPETVAWIEERIEARARARTERDFEAADAIRDELADQGIVLEDGAGGTRWKVST